MVMNEEELRELDDEDLLLALEPGTYFERDDSVFVCGDNGVRAVMAKSAWDYIRKGRPRTQTLETLDSALKRAMANVEPSQVKPTERCPCGCGKTLGQLAQEAKNDRA